MKDKPVLNSLGNKELDKAEQQFETFNENVKSLTIDRMNVAPKLDLEPQTKLSTTDIAKSQRIILKPAKIIGCREKFNEDYRSQYEFDKETVQFIAENKECPGNLIELWTKPYAGVSAMFWQVPPNKPVWGPRYLAERLKACSYHRLRMEEKASQGSDQLGNQYNGQMVVDNCINRLDAQPVSERKSIFMGAVNF
jgi:hypothetical protein